MDNEDEVARLVTGHHVVINVFNPGRGNQDVYNQQINGMKTISSEIKQAGITQLLFVGGFGNLEVKPGVYPFGVLNNKNFHGHMDPQARCLSEASGRFKKACPELFEGFVQSCPEASRRKGRSHFCAQSVLPVREHGKMATCLREADPAKAGNAAGGFFQPPSLGFARLPRRV